MAKKRYRNQFHLDRIIPLLGELVRDIKPSPERLNLDVTVQAISKNDIRDYCTTESDNVTYEKMMEHELTEEPAEYIITLKQQNEDKIERKYIDKILQDLGYNPNILFSKNHGCDFEAATNVNGYTIPGWKYFIKLLRKLNTNLAVFFGKRFAPGHSRLHLRFFEGKRTWYVIAHVDEYNWTTWNIPGIIKSHVGSGAGDYKNGTQALLASLLHYFNKSYSDYK